jgi:hypothetical protein
MEKKSLRRPKHSIIEVAKPEEEEEEDIIPSNQSGHMCWCT